MERDREVDGGKLRPDEARPDGVRPLLLLIDTAGVDGWLALAGELAGAAAGRSGAGHEGGKASRRTGADAAPRVLRTAVLPGRSSSEGLFPALRGMLVAEGHSLGEIGVVVVVLGPGSFTGIRVGVAAAKGLAEALGVPVIGLSRLAVLAACAADEAGAGSAGEDARAGSAEGTTGGAEAGRMTSALLDAGRGEVFCGRFREDEDAAAWEGLLTRDRVREVCAGDRIVAWERSVAEALPGLGVKTVSVAAAIAAALELAMRRVRAGSFDDVALLDGFYLRRTPAEVALEGPRAEAMEGPAAGRPDYGQERARS